MTRDDICVLAIKAGFDAHVSHEHWGDVFACSTRAGEASFGAMMVIFARLIEQRLTTSPGIKTEYMK